MSFLSAMSFASSRTFIRSCLSPLNSRYCAAFKSSSTALSICACVIFPSGFLVFSKISFAFWSAFSNLSFTTGITPSNCPSSFISSASWIIYSNTAVRSFSSTGVSLWTIFASAHTAWSLESGPFVSVTSDTVFAPVMSTSTGTDVLNVMPSALKTSFPSTFTIKLTFPLPLCSIPIPATALNVVASIPSTLNVTSDGAWEPTPFSNGVCTPSTQTPRPFPHVH